MNDDDSESVLRAGIFVLLSVGCAWALLNHFNLAGW